MATVNIPKSLRDHARRYADKNGFLSWPDYVRAQREWQAMQVAAE